MDSLQVIVKGRKYLSQGFYVSETIAQNWSTWALKRQINSLYFERTVSSKKKVDDEAKKNTEELILLPEDFIKDL